jgi:transcriptional/translational regulatory protein YebC/TACO1
MRAAAGLCGGDAAASSCIRFFMNYPISSLRCFDFSPSCPLSHVLSTYRLGVAGGGARRFHYSRNPGARRYTRCEYVSSSTPKGGKDSKQRTARNVGVMWEYPGSHVPQGTRQIFILPPTQMGRRSAKIATRKGAQDKKKSKLYGKIGKQIITLVKEGGPSPAANPALAVLLQQAKEADVPKDIIDRNLKKATDKGQADFVELTYEVCNGFLNCVVQKSILLWNPILSFCKFAIRGTECMCTDAFSAFGFQVYGYGGVGLVLEVLTDNFNRAAATIRDVVKKGGAKMADSGSVLFNFKRAGVIYVKADSVKSDELLLAAMDAGAEDVLEPEADEDEDNDKEEEKYACFPACALSDGNGFSFNLPSVDVSSRLLVIVGSMFNLIYIVSGLAKKFLITDGCLCTHNMNELSIYFLC